MWALFSEANEYYQPRNNLITLYEGEPSIQQLKETIYGKKLISDLKDDEIIALSDLVQKREVYIGLLDADCRLQKISFGQILPLKD